MKKKTIILLFLLFLALIVLAGYSSSLPDALEWVIGHFDSGGKEKAVFRAPVSDYTLSSEFSNFTNQIISAIMGIGIIFAIAFVYAKIRQNTSKRNSENNEA
jgi:hypothetical protein